MKKIFNKRKDTTINDLTALRAFVMPDLYPFLLESYKKEGKTENMLREDIKLARLKYKELLSQTRQPSNSGNNFGSSQERSSENQPHEESTPPSSLASCP